MIRLHLAVAFAGTALLGCHDTTTAPTPERFDSGPRRSSAISVGSYTIRDLGTLGGLSGSASGINDSGDIVGESLNARGERRATLWPADGSPPRDLGGFGDLLWSNYATAINVAGDVAGAGPGVGYTFGQRAVVWPAGGGGPRDLGDLPENRASGANAINDARDVVGVSQVMGAMSSSPHATLWPASGGPPRDLGSLGGPRSTATDVNSAGTIVGFSDVSTNQTHATVWLVAGGPPRDLGTPVGGDYSAAQAINDAGDIVGDANYALFWQPRGLSHATLWRADGSPPKDLGTLGAILVDQSFARGINNRGDIVGWSYTPNGESHAALWPADRSGPVDLGVLTGTYSAAVAINSSGVIVGKSRDASGQMRPVVWEPVRHPQSITFVSTPPDGAIVGGTYTISATGGGSGNVVTFSSLAPTVCSVTGNAVSLDAGGTCTIAADQEGNAGYLAAPQVMQSFDINTRPVASAGSAQSGNEGSTITFNAANSSDADGDALVAYTWDFGDGTVVSVTSSTVEHIYSDNKTGGGAYVVALQVTDANGAKSAVSNTSALIDNIAPSATFDPASPVGEGTLNLSLTGVQDAPGDIATLALAFDCGDGSGYGPFSASSSITCTVADDGVRSVRAKIKDKDGATVEYAKSVTVVNVAPSITIVSGPASGKPGAYYILQFRFTDPGTLDAPWSVQTIWGDGKNPLAPSAVSAQGETITQSYRYNKAGSYTITVRVTDKNGATGISSVPVTIVR